MNNYNVRWTRKGGTLQVLDEYGRLILAATSSEQWRDSTPGKPSCPVTREEAEANADLAALAPELLASLDTLIRALPMIVAPKNSEERKEGVRIASMITALNLEIPRR